MRSRPALATPAARRRREGVAGLGLGATARAPRAARARSSARPARRAAARAPARRRRAAPPSRERSSTSSGLASTVTSACGVSRGRKSSSSRSSRAGPSRLGVPPPRYSVSQAAHAVRRLLAAPLLAQGGHVAVQQRLGARRAGRVAHGQRGEVAVVAARAAEGHVHVHVPHGAREGRGLSGRRRVHPPWAPGSSRRRGARAGRCRRSSRSRAARRCCSRRSRCAPGRCPGRRQGQRRGQHGRGVAAAPRRGPHVVADVAAAAQQVVA